MIDIVGTSTLLYTSQWNYRHKLAVFTAQTNPVVWNDASPAAVGPLITPSENLLTHLMGAQQFNRSKTFWWNEVNWEGKIEEILILPRGI